MKDTLNEVKDNLQRTNSTVDEAENQINDMEHKEAKNKQSVKTRRKMNLKNEDSVSSLWDNFKHYNICIVGVSGETKVQGIGNLFEK